METVDDANALEKLLGQLSGLHGEIGQLAKKSPNDGVNSFELGLINTVIREGNTVLGDEYRPFSDFKFFDSDDLPTNSDVTMILGQYLEQAQRFRSDNVEWDGNDWVYVVDEVLSKIKTSRPSRKG
jgi:hypothetical protein